MSVKLLTEHHLEFLSVKGGGTGSSESTLVKMPLCWSNCMRKRLEDLLTWKSAEVLKLTLFIHLVLVSITKALNGVDTR